MRTSGLMHYNMVDAKKRVCHRGGLSDIQAAVFVLNRLTLYLSQSIGRSVPDWNPSAVAKLQRAITIVAVIIDMSRIIRPFETQ